MLLKDFTISTTFFPQADFSVEDFTIISNDFVIFRISADLLSQTSSNYFGQLLDPGTYPASRVIQAPDTANVLEIILHAVYDLVPPESQISYQGVMDAVNRFSFYGLDPQAYIKPSKPLFDVLVSLTPLDALHMYGIAASHDLHGLAAVASSYLLSPLSLAALSDELALRIGPIYLNKLFQLHLRRMQILKELLLIQPRPHPETDSCTLISQRQVLRAWAMAGSQLAWMAAPDLSTKVLQATFEPLLVQFSCPKCRKTMGDLIRHIIVQWTMAERTI
ncbi:hypothetical protein C8J56DRAFT_795835 [Mycena floridula]|nr:hypothetical protein C8J56DRAFT_795835 [Mycena floridula]